MARVKKCDGFQKIATMERTAIKVQTMAQNKFVVFIA